MPDNSSSAIFWTALGCAIAGLQGKPFHALREQFEEYRAPGRCTLIGGGKTSADQAALFNSSQVRYVDLLDSYMAIELPGNHVLKKTTIAFRFKCSSSRFSTEVFPEPRRPNKARTGV